VTDRAHLRLLGLPAEAKHLRANADVRSGEGGGAELLATPLERAGTARRTPA
jgi:hypothetical protein